MSTQRFEVVGFDEFRDDHSDGVLVLLPGEFRREELAYLTPEAQLAWILVLMTAVTSNNSFELTKTAVRMATGVKTSVDLNIFRALGLVAPANKEAGSCPVTPEPPPQRKQNYVQAGVSAWAKRFAGGVIAFGRVGKAFKPLVEKHGDTVVLEAWERYLSSSESKFMSPENFASRFGEWAGLASELDQREDKRVRETKELAEKRERGDIL